MNSTMMVVVARVVLGLSFALSACVTVTGPEITSEEEKQARILLHAEAEAFQKAAFPPNHRREKPNRV